MKDSLPYMVWKVYRLRFSENTELAKGRNLILLLECAVSVSVADLFLLRRVVQQAKSTARAPTML